MKTLIENSNLTKDNLKVLYKHCLEEAPCRKMGSG